VPSCDIHNLNKSMDDEFLMLILTGNIKNNDIAVILSKTKIARSFLRKSEQLKNQFLKEAKERDIIFNGTISKAIEFSPDYDRIVRCLENIAYGLYFHEFNNIFLGECRVFLGFIDYRDDFHKNLNLLMKELFINSPYLDIVKGENPKIFTYQFGFVDVNGLIPLKLTFFEGTEVYIAFKPEDVSVPYDLTMDLMKNGIKVFVNPGNGKMIEFN
jgi:hypothetical protein